MLIYNSLSGKKERLPKPRNRPLRLFVCGPTVYDFSHLGHARTYLSFDIVVRYLKSQNFKIFYLQNITDIDDKIINRAKKEKRNPFELARFFKKAHYQDMEKLKITSVDRYAGATDFIPQIIKQVQVLIKKGYAYKIENDGYYFDISKFKDYGKLSRRTAQQAEDAVSRIDESVRKRNKGDFCLWKFVHANSAPPHSLRSHSGNAKAPMRIINGEPAWYTHLGWGRPGWHIEDTAISENYFGPQYDLHGGAIELKFPHHEAEIAQQEAASGKKPFVKIWMHTGLLYINGQKMAKSLKNFIAIKDFLKAYPPELLRWIVLNHHYRSPLNYTETLLSQAQNSLKNIEEFLAKIDFVKSKSRVQKGEIKNSLKKTEREFCQAMTDDFNTPAALAAIFNLINEINPEIWSLSKKEALLVKKFIAGNLKNLGFEIKIFKIPQKIQKIARERELLRVNKQFIQSDALRNKIKRLGYEAEDTPLGPWLKPI
jgi:cysteinyl-tRNA synthetase